VSSASGGIAYAKFSANVYNSAYGIDDILVSASTGAGASYAGIVRTGIVRFRFCARKNRSELKGSPISRSVSTGR